jgi:hypothetical protein
MKGRSCGPLPGEPAGSPHRNRSCRVRSARATVFARLAVAVSAEVLDVVADDIHGPVKAEPSPHHLDSQRRRGWAHSPSRWGRSHVTPLGRVHCCPLALASLARDPVEGPALLCRGRRRQNATSPRSLSLMPTKVGNALDRESVVMERAAALQARRREVLTVRRVFPPPRRLGNWGTDRFRRAAATI